MKYDLTTLILCGGKGERLKPMTDEMPKPLIHIKGQPILYHLVNYFQTYGFHDFISISKIKTIYYIFDKMFFIYNYKRLWNFFSNIF